MLYNVTHTNKDDIKEINTLVGKPIGFLKSIQLGGIGSRRMTISSVSSGFKAIINDVSDINYGSIELRPKGILLYATQQLKRFAWAIPYHQLVVYNSSFFSVHANGNFIQFIKDKNYSANKKFIDTMLQEKINLLNLGYYDG